MADGERSPLLPPEAGPGPGGAAAAGGAGAGPGEAPPPYSPLGSPEAVGAGPPAVTCRVCQRPISVEGKTHQHVVKCGGCGEATTGAPSPDPPPGGVRVACAHCGGPFLWAELPDRSLARCPHCRKVSAIGRRFPRRRCLCCLLGALLMGGAAAGLAAGTWWLWRRARWVPAAWAVLGAGAGACLLRAAYWGCVRVSQPLPPRA
ncbi:type 1 phosphatidylinositol 4,5-bisphosphate 4-phosphatase isoform X1 [Oenanthe melanoleuca]|uniref:type 1 phosphatidylinositol 4,5-bisphosphate 4-phosphatase isoform X1 n=1 Tax=Oenanthe melanoleuca TaxID=2939378 RepID=UPI0024C15801|nr:type 1 phosphatidylinositol 4,5-bisphosphate 4-phosphatase isoform X1 [Oenanthe melanoleuca]